MRKEVHPVFKEYQNFIINHPNYEGLYDGKGWVKASNDEGRLKRKEWAIKKAEELSIPYNTSKMYRDIMFHIHPTKEKPCLVCGRIMSLEYKYLNFHMVNSLYNTFGLKFDKLTTIEEVLEELLLEFEENDVRTYLVRRFDIIDDNENINELILKCIKACEDGRKGHLGPGALSNYPDRLDGFHTYNKCCRSVEDRGRHKENMRTYGKDRRAYEYISDGNIRAADLYMKHDTFLGRSADHIGPISLGFLHDPMNLSPLSVGENSAKRNRLFKSDIEEIFRREDIYSEILVSWYNEKIWNKYKSSKDFEKLRELELALREGCATFLTILHTLHVVNNDSVDIIDELIIKPKLKYYKYDYEFLGNGDYTYNERKVTENTKKEEKRFGERILETISEYGAKSNRRKKIELDNEVIEKLNYLKADHNNLKEEFEKIVYTEQDKIILKYQI